jgi:hypothetical protein
MSLPYGAEVVIGDASPWRAGLKRVLPVGDHTVRITNGTDTQYFTISVTETGPTKWCYDFNKHTPFVESCPK